ncbi:hypothetical protein [Actinoallomurus sp. CA-142502]|uniref:hypothetical protein n=1 Tax=Actinoallomurus sp. CA-142502 TaxID=3239885 RepID=UPI003D89B2CC
MDEAVAWFTACPLSRSDHTKIGAGNTRRLFDLWLKLILMTRHCCETMTRQVNRH